MPGSVIPARVIRSKATEIVWKLTCKARGLRPLKPRCRVFRQSERLKGRRLRPRPENQRAESKSPAAVPPGFSRFFCRCDAFGMNVSTMRAAPLPAFKRAANPPRLRGRCSRCLMKTPRPAILIMPEVRLSPVDNLLRKRDREQFCDPRHCVFGGADRGRGFVRNPLSAAGKGSVSAWCGHFAHLYLPNSTLCMPSNKPKSNGALCALV